MKHLYIYLSLIVFSLAFVSCDCDDDCSACDQLPEVGPCDAAIPIYYYDQDSMKCVQFIWGGCDGVVPFETLEACEECDC